MNTSPSTALVRLVDCPKFCSLPRRPVTTTATLALLKENEKRFKAQAEKWKAQYANRPGE